MKKTLLCLSLFLIPTLVVSIAQAGPAVTIGDIGGENFAAVDSQGRFSVVIPTPIATTSSGVTSVIVVNPTNTLVGVSQVNVKFPSTTIVGTVSVDIQGVAQTNIKFPSTTIVGTVPVDIQGIAQTNVKFPSTTIVGTVPVDVQGVAQTNIKFPSTTIVGTVAVDVQGVAQTNVKFPSTTVVGISVVKSTESIWVYVSQAVVTPDVHVELGAANKLHTYTVTAQGGFASFRINQGELIFINNGETESEIISPFEIFPATINVIDLQSGATLFVKLTGGKK